MVSAVCVDCAMLIANGETPTEMNEDETKAWLDSMSDDNFVLGIGIGEDGCSCVSSDEADEDYEETGEHHHQEVCESTYFSWSRCDSCDSNLGGDRFPATIMEIN